MSTTGSVTMVEAEEGDSKAKDAHLVHLATGRGHQRHESGQFLYQTVDLVPPLPLTVSPRQPVTLPSPSSLLHATTNHI